MGTIKLDNILYGYMVSDPAVFYLFSEHLNEVQCIRQCLLEGTSDRIAFRLGQRSCLLLSFKPTGRKQEVKERTSGQKCFLSLNSMRKTPGEGENRLLTP